MSIASFIVLLYFEMASDELNLPYLNEIMMYLTPLVMATLTLYLFPMNIFYMTQSE